MVSGAGGEVVSGAGGEVVSGAGGEVVSGAGGEVVSGADHYNENKPPHASLMYSNETNLHATFNTIINKKSSIVRNIIQKNNDDKGKVPVTINQAGGSYILMLAFRIVLKIVRQIINYSKLYQILLTKLNSF